MAQKIVRLGFPKAKPEYAPAQLDQLVDTLEQLIQQLNTTYLQPDKDDQERFNFFMS